MAIPQKITTALTQRDIIYGLRQLGLEKEMVVEVHSSLSSFGYVVGGAQTINDALVECVGYDGTIAMAMQNRNNTDPVTWKNPQVPHDLQKEVRNSIPVFDRKSFDTTDMGVVADNFRRRQGTMLSFGPSCGYAAWGKYARLICGRQPLHFPLGEESPTAHLYDLDAVCLWMGVDLSVATSVLLAYYRANRNPIITKGCAVEIDGKRVWKKYLDIDLTEEDFQFMETALRDRLRPRTVKIGEAECSMFKIKEAVDILVQVLKKRV